MFQNTKTSFLKYLQPLLHFSRCIGVVYFDDANTKNNFLANICRLCNIILILLLLRLCFTTSKSILFVTYTNHSKVNTVSDLILHICVSSNIFFRQLNYFWNRKRFQTFLRKIDTLDESLRIDRSDSSNLRKQILVSLGYNLVLSVMSITLITLSSLQTASTEVSSFFGLQYQIMFCEMCIWKIILNEFSILFSNINENFKIAEDTPEVVNSLVFMSKVHLKLSRIILKNEDVINASLLGTLLTFFIQIVTSLTGVLKNAKACMELVRVDPIFMLWCSLNCIQFLAFIWFLIRMRMGVVNEVSATKSILCP